MSGEKTRREFLAAGVVAAFGAVLTRSPSALAAAPKIDVLERRVIRWKPPLYHGWPTLARRKNGELLLVFSGGREKHVCPFGRVELLRLRDGRLLMSYGQRRKPLGNLARVSDDNGRSWSEPLTISDDAKSVDMGDPSTVECDDVTLVTVWYELLAGSPNAQLRQARWRLV